MACCLSPSLSQQLLQFADIAARNGDGIVAVTYHELHGAGIGGYLFHLTKINHEGTMTTDYHGIVLQRVFHLFHRGTKHIGMYLIAVQLADFNIVAYGLYI